MNGKRVNRNAKHRLYMSLFNTKEWHQLRSRKIAECKGLCERCRREGIEKGILPDGYITPANTVHHINPVEGVPDEPADTLLDRMKERCFDYNNLILLCPACHHKTHEEMKSHRNQMRSKMPIDPATGQYKPVRMTRFGWVTKDEYQQRKREETEKRRAMLDPNYEINKQHESTDTQGAPTMDAPSED